jgi:hypothetical protein
MMWNDEDNNPYGTSFERSDSNLSSSPSTANPTNLTSSMSPYLANLKYIQDDVFYSA